MREALNVHLNSPLGAVVTYGPVIYVVWRSHDSTDPFAIADEAVRGMVKKYGEARKLFYVHRTPASFRITVSDGPLRDAAMAHFDRTERYFSAAAVGMEVSGFGGSVMRSITAGILLVRKTEMKTQIFKDARDGVRWLATYGKDTNPFDAEHMVKELEARDLSLGASAHPS